MTKHQDITPKYATLMYDNLHKLEVTITEYFYLDMVYHLSRDGWCYKSLDSIAADMRMHRNGVQKMKDRLVERGLLKKNIKGHVKTTVTYHSVLQQPSKSSHSVTNHHTQYDRTVPLSVTKNNNENNKDYKKGLGYKKALEVRNSLKSKFSTH